MSSFNVKFAEKKKNMAEGIYYPLGQQSFRELRNDECVYVDKTQYIAKMLESKHRYWFLARPRRFGKSLFLSALKYFFQGERELFKGLYIDSINRDWKQHPVLRLDLNVQKYKEEGLLDVVLDRIFREWEENMTSKLKTRTIPRDSAQLLSQHMRRRGERL